MTATTTTIQTIYGKRIESDGYPEYSEYFLGTEAPEGFEILLGVIGFCDRDAIDWADEHLTPGMLVRSQDGIHMVDSDHFLMKAGYHIIDPRNAHKLAGLPLPAITKKVIAPIKKRVL